MTKCFIGWEEAANPKGRCCCNCKHQVLVMKHPWNKTFAKGAITEILGALCTTPDFISETGRRQGVFFDTGHGMCEMHEFKETQNV
jgi:hypothetical protein